jgi:hypothetical protein
MRWTTLRGLKKFIMQAMLAFASMNLKKLATWFWKSGGSKHPIRDFVSQLMKIYNKLPSPQNETREFVFSHHICFSVNKSHLLIFLHYSSCLCFFFPEAEGGADFR